MKRQSRLEVFKSAFWAKKRWLKRIKRSYRANGNSSYDAIKLIAPEILSFSSNSKMTLRFFQKLKQAVFTSETIRRKGNVIRKPISVELSTIKSISLPSAVILAAELHRWKLSQKTELRMKNHNMWTKRVRGLMSSLGVFELLGIKNLSMGIDPHKEVVLLKLESGIKRDGQAVANLQSWMKSMKLGFGEKKFVFGALDEAIINGFEHAYIDTGVDPRFPYAGHRWWATSCFDPVSNSLRFFVYDQGRGIPATLPRQNDFWPSIKKLIGDTSENKNDAQVIETAFTIGKTRTNLSERGKGLSKMREAIELAGEGYLRVLSGKGDITFGPHATLKKTNHDSHIGGTLVEWSIPIAALQDTGPNYA